MKQLIRYKLEHGGSVVVEVDVPDGLGMKPAGIKDGFVEAEKTFEAAFEEVRKAASVVVCKLRDLAESPDELEVSFGLKMNGKAGTIFASAGAEANFNVTLTWKKG
ncbi:MAG TPA: CU044_2847 family protein [Planctomycetota bacterium]|nr:CU044_2847 family protein [Planctomycetota bacterium]